MDEPEADIESIDIALTFATDTDTWRTWSEYVDKLLDQRLEVTSQR